jgi:hypothetical protein
MKKTIPCCPVENKTSDGEKTLSRKNSLFVYFFLYFCPTVGFGQADVLCASMGPLAVKSIRPRVYLLKAF